MARRSQRNLEFLLFLPWWVSAGLGVLFFLLSTAFIDSFAKTGGPIGRGIALSAGWLPYFLLFVFGTLALGSAIIRWKRGSRFESQTSIESIRGLSWSEFENLVAEAYRRKGFTVEQSLAGGADGGVDLVLRKDGQTTLVQCKQWRTMSVGAPIIREQYGLMMHENARRVIVVTSGHFTREAEDFARGKPMELIDGGQLLEIVRGVQTQPRPSSLGSTQAPVCPKCGSPMVLRTAKKGPNADSSFWGCSTYPKCTGTRKA